MPCLPIGVVPGVTVAALRSLRAPASVPPSSRLGPARGDALPLCSALCWGCLGGRQPDHHTRSPGDPAQRVGGSAEPREGSRGWQGVTLANEWVRVSGQLGVGVLVCVGRGPSVLGRRRAGQRGRRVDGLLSSRWVWEGVGTRLGSTVRVPKPGSGLGPGTLSRVRPSVCVCVCVCEGGPAQWEGLVFSVPVGVWDGPSPGHSGLLASARLGHRGECPHEWTGLAPGRMKSGGAASSEGG